MQQVTNQAFNKIHTMRYALILSLAAIFFQNCKNNAAPTTAQNVQVAEPGSDLPADFKSFYEKFHEDSLYQIAHISWPLEGWSASSQDSSVTAQRSYHWQPNEWRMHRAVDYSNGKFARECHMIGDLLVVEKICTNPMAYCLERRFAKGVDGQWSLIYYADMHAAK